MANQNGVNLAAIECKMSFCFKMLKKFNGMPEVTLLIMWNIQETSAMSISYIYCTSSTKVLHKRDTD